MKNDEEEVLEKEDDENEKPNVSPQISNLLVEENDNPKVEELCFNLIKFNMLYMQKKYENKNYKIGQEKYKVELYKNLEKMLVQASSNTIKKHREIQINKIYNWYKEEVKKYYLISTIKELTYKPYDVEEEEEEESDEEFNKKKAIFDNKKKRTQLGVPLQALLKKFLVKKLPGKIRSRLKKKKLGDDKDQAVQPKDKLMEKMFGKDSNIYKLIGKDKETFFEEQKKYQEEHRIKYEYEQYVPPKPSEKKEKEEEEEEKEEEEKEEEEKKEVKVEVPKVEEEKAKPIEEEKANEEKGEGEEEKKEGEVEGEAGEAKEIEDKAKEIDKVKSKAQTSKGSVEETKTDEGPNYGWDFFTRTKNETVVKKDNKFAVCPRLNKLIYKPDMLPPNKEIKSSYSYLRPKAKEDNLTFEKAIMKSKEKKVAEARNLKEISSNLKIFGEQKANFNSVKNKKYELKELIKLYNIKKDDSESTCINFPFELKTPKDEVIDYEKEKRSFNYQSKVPPFLERFSEGNKIKKVSTSFARNMNRNSNTLFKLGEEKKINLKCSLDKEECLDRLIEYQLHKGLVENHSEKCFEEIPRGQIGRLYRTRINYGELVNCNIIDAHKKEITNFVNPISFVDKDHYLSRNRSEGKPKNYMITKNFFNLNRSASSCAEFIKDNVLVDQRQNFLNLRKKLDNMKIREMNKLKHKLTSKINEMSLKNSFVSPSIQGSVCGSNLPKGFLGLLKNIEKN